MGESVDTTTRLLDRFETRHRHFRAELRPREQRLFDDLVAWARQRSNALNRYADLDAERVVTLAMLMALAARAQSTTEELHAARAGLAGVQSDLQEVMQYLELAPRRVPRWGRAELDRMGQKRLTDYGP